MKLILLLAFTIHFSLRAQSLLIPYLSGEVYGLADESGRVVIPPQYEDINLHADKGLIAIKKDGLWGIVDMKGNTILKPFIKVDVPQPNYMGIPNGPIIQTIFFNSPSLPVEPFQNTRLYKVEDKYAKVFYYVNPKFALGEYHPFVDPEKVRKQSVYTSPKPLQTGIIKVGTPDQQINFIDTTGQLIFKNHVFDGEALTSHIIAVQNEDGKYALFNRASKQLTGFIYDRVNRNNYEMNFIIASRPDSLNKSVSFYSLYNGEGKLLSGDQRKNFDSKGKIAIINQDTFARIVDYQGKAIASFENAELRLMSYDSSKFYVVKKEKFGVVDLKGNYLLDPYYKGIKRLRTGKYIFQTGLKGGLMNDNFKVIWSLDSIRVYDNNNESGYFSIGKNKGWREKTGLVDSLGTVIIPPIYDRLSYFKKSKVVSVTRDTVQAIFDLKGEIILPWTKDRLDISDERQVINIHSANQINKLDLTPLQTYSVLRTPRLQIMQKNGFAYLAHDNKQPITDAVYKSINESSLSEPCRFLYIARKTDANDEFIDIYNDKGKMILPVGYGIYYQKLHAGTGKGDLLAVFNKEDAINFNKSWEQSTTMVPFRVGIINLDGEWIIKPDYHHVSIHGGEIIHVLGIEDSEGILYNRYGKRLGEKSYTTVQRARDDKIKFNRLIVGRPANPEDYLKVLNKAANIKSTEDLMALSKSGNFPKFLVGAVDLKGKEVIPLKYSAIDEFIFPHTVAKGVDENGIKFTSVIDTSGKELIRTNKEDLEYLFGDSLILKFKENGLTGIMNIHGTVLLEAKYVDIDIEENFKAVVVRDSDATYVRPWNTQYSITKIGPVARPAYQTIHTDIITTIIMKIEEGKRIKHYHLFEKDGKYLAGYTVSELTETFSGAGLPKGYVAIKENKESKVYIANYENGIKFKSH